MCKETRKYGSNSCLIRVSIFDIDIEFISRNNKIKSLALISLVFIGKFFDLKLGLLASCSISKPTNLLLVGYVCV